MAITVLTRPEKTLSNGFLSKWNSSELPLRYSFDSDLFPINKVDSIQVITNVAYDSAKQGTVITLVANPYINKEFVTITDTNTDLDNGNYQIKEIDGLNIVLDVFTSDSSNTGNTLKYYRNYLGLVKVFAGAREGHPYNTDGSKPLQEIGVIEIDFTDDGTDNTGYANVKSFIKPDITAEFDNDFENSHFAWTSFYLQTAESYDDVVNGNIETVTTPFIDDSYDNCIPFVGYEDDSFNNGLDDWLEQNITNSFDTPWVTGVGSVSVSITQSSQTRPFYSEILYQNITLVNNNTYQFDLDIVYSGDAPSCNVQIVNTSGSILGQVSISSSGVYSIFVTPNSDVTGVGVAFGTVPLGTTANITLNQFIATYNGSAENQCLAFNYATFGCKQFQDNLGGNFGDYVLNIVDTITPKMLTHFDELSYFQDKPFYLNAIIPESTFSQSEGGDSVYVYIELFDDLDNSVLSFTYKVDDLSDGVYTIDPSIGAQSTFNNLDGCAWKYGVSRFIIIPSNTFIDGNNGTFEGVSGLDGITILTYSGGTPNQVGNSKTQLNFARSGVNCMGVEISAPSMSEPLKTYSLFTNDSSINVVEGRTYQINAYLSVQISAIDSRHINNGSLYFLPNGYTESECNVTKQFISTDFVYSTVEPTFDDWKEVTTTFVAKTTESITLTFYEDIINDIPDGTGGFINVDDVTFKGPFEFISEEKKIVNKCGCSFYGVNLRWKNDLNGWENWYFDKKAVFSENVTKKINIQRDITSNWDDTFINGQTQNDTIKTEANKSVLVRSQLLTKNEQETIQQIRRSVKVQMLMDSGKWQTVTIKQGSFIINDQDDKTRELSFTINLPQIQIQEQ